MKDKMIADIEAMEDLDDMHEVHEYDTYWDGEEFHVKSATSAGACTSLVLGIVGSLAWLAPIIGMPITIVGTVFGAMNFKSKKAKGLAIAGFVVNLVFLSASIAKGTLDIIKYFRKSK